MVAGVGGGRSHHLEARRVYSAASPTPVASTLPIPIVLPSSRSVKRPSCGHWSKGSRQTFCTVSMTHVITAPVVVRLRRQRIAQNCAELRQNCARGVPLLTNIGFFFDFFPLLSLIHI